MPEIITTYYASPIGMLKIAGSFSTINEVLFCRADERVSYEIKELPPVIMQCREELTAYFNGARRTFDVPVQQEGTEFQKRVWNELMLIPFGKTVSYLELAKRLGDVKSIRAAASTNGKNKIAVIIPCHRVIGSNRNLVGYAGGIPNKRWLLEHEARIAHGVQTLF
jgi:methylated-DNA-[protein]-cysteine S-methyltransferase